MARPVTEKRVLTGKVAIVTGARRGIGAAEAVALAAAGATVVICDLVYEDLLTVKDRIEDDGGTCLAVKCDVSQKAQVAHVVDETMSAYADSTFWSTTLRARWIPRHGRISPTRC